ncbi:TIGR04222 domain-containing membrane protein [Bradyrhizobium ontarionense]|uniref:TIGR04222 domain-containing membrane protein n=1 Tax=Bradyrhizobium ontarionense TaxID=2898149 RepID=A0ABY3R4R6_9BRAD|nr:TIGR04222 domain-containing membrane protein [Bradyrhizobium sp. A19]UFZ01732.1 TIGR04222 domain-containing membrane protein [Bradyrhizobium sp. A19]
MPLNPFDWTAGPFLLLYVASAALIFWLGFRTRRTIGPAASTIHPLRELELAYLAGGEPRLGDAVLLGLASKNAATFTPRDHRITVTDQAALATLIDRPPRLGLHPEMTRPEFQKALGPLVARIRDRLTAIGYYPSNAQMTAFRSSVLPFVGALLLFGAIKAVVGSERHHPVGFLLILLAATCFAAYILAKPPTRTRAGNDALRNYQASHTRAGRAPREHELLLAVALSGAVVLSGTAYASVLATSKALGSSGDGGGGGCGGGGGGGGCGGCS